MTVGTEEEVSRACCQCLNLPTPRVHRFIWYLMVAIYPGDISDLDACHFKSCAGICESLEQWDVELWRSVWGAVVAFIPPPNCSAHVYRI